MIRNFHQRDVLFQVFYKGWFKSFQLVILDISSELTSVKWEAARIFQASGGIAANWINLTDTCRRAGLPVESVVHLNAGDPGLALQVVARITREGHRVAGLLALSAAAAVHGRPRVPAGGRHWTCKMGTWPAVLTFHLPGYLRRR